MGFLIILHVRLSRKCKAMGYKSTIRSILLSMLFIPTSITLLLLVLLLVCNSFNIFYVHIPSSSSSSVEPETNIALSSSNYTDDSSPVSLQFSSRPTRKLRTKKHKRRFSQRVNRFFFSPSLRPCKPRFFMTWISSLESFSRREVLTIESLFRNHLDACLLILSTQMDSDKGLQILRPFLDSNLSVMAVAPDLDYLFKNTAAAGWFHQLKRGRVKPGEISLAQNLSNLLRLALLYKYGGIYMDTDFIILRSLSKLRNVIGAQNSDPRTREWTRLNNAVMIFDKHHPLIEKFIEEFALTFNGNKWGHNGPYLVSRVVKRVTAEETAPNEVELNFTVVPPSAFYPVDWGRIGKLFRWWEEEEERCWMERKEEQIRKESYGVHLWNRQTRNLIVENGSVIAKLMLNSCLFCNFTSLAFQI